MSTLKYGEKINKKEKGKKGRGRSAQCQYMTRMRGMAKLATGKKPADMLRSEDLFCL